MRTFREIIELWETRIAFAEAVNIAPVTASAWWQRDSIPPACWNDVVSAAQRLGGVSVSLKLLADIAARKRAAA